MRGESNAMRLLLRYGTTIVIALTFVGVGVMLSKISIRNKVPMQIVLEQDGKIYGHVDRPRLMRDSVMISAYSEDNVKLEFMPVSQTRSQMVELHPKDSVGVYNYLATRHIITAYLYDGETRLIELVFRKWSKR
jgi:hypothetical protein